MILNSQINMIHSAISSSSMSASAKHKTRKTKYLMDRQNNLSVQCINILKNKSKRGGALISVNKVLEHTTATCKVRKNLMVNIGKEKSGLLTDYSDTE